jgi:hypothetical protein
LTISSKLSHRKEILLDLFLVFLFTAILIKPLFKAKYLDKWASIESTFISDARFLAAHWPHPQWQPLWYAGTRFDYIYPPMLRYGTAAIARVTGFWPVKAYHFYTAFFYCVGIAGVYLLIRVGMKSRRAAYLGAIATALMSPSLLILKNFRADAWHLLPVRLGVLAKYGEGPHMTALACIPFALAFTWLALERTRPGAVALAAVACAAVASNNFYGATALAVFYPILLWSFWITRLDRRIFIAAAAIPVLAYGLTAFWLVPSYFKITVENMKYVSEHGTTWSIWVALIVAVAYAIATDRLARGRAERTWAVFAAGCVVFFSLNVLGNNFFNFRVSGEPLRLVPELDLVLILGVLTVLAWLWNREGRAPRIAAGLVVVAAFATTLGYIGHAWQMFPLWNDYTDRVEYKITEWLGKNMPQSRAYASGSVRFWFDAWRDLAQVGGGSEQGLLNGAVENAQWEINLGAKAEPSILWLQATGADSVYIADKRSQEIFKDFLYPAKFTGVLPVLYDDHEGNVIYGVPRRYPALARVVETARIDAAAPPRFNDDLERLRAYADTIEKGPESQPSVTRIDTENLVVRAKVEPGQSILVQQTYDPAWQASEGGKPLRLHKDAMGMTVVDVAPGDREVRLSFVTPFENYAGRVLTLLALLAVVGLLAMEARARRPA